MIEMCFAPKHPVGGGWWVLGGCWVLGAKHVSNSEYKRLNPHFIVIASLGLGSSYTYAMAVGYVTMAMDFSLFEGLRVMNVGNAIRTKATLTRISAGFSTSSCRIFWYSAMLCYAAMLCMICHPILCYAVLCYA